MSIWGEPHLIDLAVKTDWRQDWDQGRVRLLAASEDGFLAVGSSGLDLVSSTGVDFNPDHHVWLGLVDGTPLFAALDETPTTGLREALGQLDPVGIELAMRAAALARYHSSHHFCPQCGQPTQATDLGRSRTCDGCGTVDFPRIDPAIIVAVTDDQDRLLLGHHSGWENKRYSVLAGFVEAGESLEQTVRREVAEEVGVVVDQIRYVGSQPWPMPRSLMIAFTAVATSTTLTPDGEEIVAARWFTRNELDEAVATAQITLPSPASIASQLIASWHNRRTDC